MSGFGRRIAGGALFQRLRTKAAEYLSNPDKLRDLVRTGTAKAESLGATGPLEQVWTSLMALLRLLRAYGRREYTNVPWQTLTLIVAGILYLLSPIDVIPDFIVGLGFVDDAAVLAWVVSTVQSVLDDFQRWETETKN